MPVVQEYAFRALDPSNGKIVKGRIEGAGEKAVVTRLISQGLTPVEVSRTASRLWTRDLALPGARRSRASALAVFSRQMASLIDAGLPLMRALEVLVEHSDDAALRKAISRVQASVESGTSFSDALGEQSDVFPPLMVSLIQAGEAGGFLGDALGAVAAAYAKESTLQNKIRAAVAYPAVVLLIAVVGMIVMSTVIVPVFEGMFASLGSALPVPTRVMLAISHSMVWVLPLLVLLVAGAVIGWRSGRNRPGVRRVVDGITLRLPVFGPLATKVAVARFCRSLATMLGAGVPLLQALPVVGRAADNYPVARAVSDVEASIRQGRSFAEPLSRHAVFPALVAQMAAVGEESGTLPDMLGSLADFYEDEVDAAAEQLTSIIEPVLIVVVGVLIGAMVISLYLPIFTLYGDLARSQ